MPGALWYNDLSFQINIRPGWYFQLERLLGQKKWPLAEWPLVTWSASGLPAIRKNHQVTNYYSGHLSSPYRALSGEERKAIDFLYTIVLISYFGHLTAQYHFCSILRVPYITRRVGEFFLDRFKKPRAFVWHKLIPRAIDRWGTEKRNPERGLLVLKDLIWTKL